MYGSAKKLSKLKIKNQSEEHRIIKSIRNHFKINEVKPYLKDIITDLQKCDAENIQLRTAVNFTSSKDADEEKVIHLKSDNTEGITYDDANEFIKEISSFQIGLEISITFSNFFFDGANFLYYKCHRINFRRDGL